MAEEKKIEPGTEADSTPESRREEREKSFSRRALIQAGWSIPVIMAVNPVSKAFALTSGFGDAPFEDVTPFNDFNDFNDHDDTPHNDGDAHNDGDRHSDGPGDHTDADIGVDGPEHSDGVAHSDGLEHDDAPTHDDAAHVDA